jgi:hypothetical protein
MNLDKQTLKSIARKAKSLTIWFDGNIQKAHHDFISWREHFPDLSEVHQDELKELLINEYQEFICTKT